MPKVSREKWGTVSNEVSRERSVLEGQYGWRRWYWSVLDNVDEEGDIWYLSIIFMSIVITIPYILIPVWMILSFNHHHRSARKREFCIVSESFPSITMNCGMLPGLDGHLAWSNSYSRENSVPRWRTSFFVFKWYRKLIILKCFFAFCKTAPCCFYPDTDLLFCSVFEVCNIYIRGIWILSLFFFFFFFFFSCLICIPSLSV